ncbi:MAG: glycosyltransferase [Bacteroidia bacterium]|nr:glycosyltransferase [Bacteroidia bacterium]
MTTVSVLLPFCREGEWLLSSVESILKQSIVDFELILTGNDADTHTQAIAASLAAGDPRILLCDESKKGIAHALNKGLSLAKGKYIARMDADDFSLPDRLLKQFKFLESDPSALVVATQTASHPEGPPGKGFHHFMNWQNNLVSPEDHWKNRFVESPLAHPTVFFHRSLYERYGGYLTDGSPEDYELWLRWMEQGISIQKIPEALLLWRDHDLRLSRTSAEYTQDAFFRMKSAYLCRWIRQNIPERKIIVCGAHALNRKRVKILEEHAIQIHGYTDITERSATGKAFYPALQLKPSGEFFYLSLVSGRGKGDEIRLFLNSRGLKEEEDFLIAG